MISDPQTAGPRLPFRDQHQTRSGFQEFGRLDILVNNAAFQGRYASIDDITDDEWDHTFRTNIYSMFCLVKAAAAMVAGSATPKVMRKLPGTGAVSLRFLTKPGFKEVAPNA